MAMGDLEVDRWGSMSGATFLQKRTQPGQHEVNMGHLCLSGSFRCSRSSALSSIMVRSAPKLVSNTYLKPIWRRAAASLRGVASSRGMPVSSAQAVRTAGATCTMTILSGSDRAFQTFSLSSRARRAATGQCVMHWPQRVHVYCTRPTRVRAPALIRSHTCMPWTLSQTEMQRMQRMHLVSSRIRGNVLSHGCWRYRIGYDV